MKFVRAFFDAGKPVASICHGPWTLIEAGVVKGRRMTSWPSLKTDLQNAGATWENKEVVTDNNLVTSRMPSDIPVFNRQMIDLFATAKQNSSSASDRVPLAGEFFDENPSGPAIVRNGDRSPVGGLPGRIEAPRQRLRCRVRPRSRDQIPPPPHGRINPATTVSSAREGIDQGEFLMSRHAGSTPWVGALSLSGGAK